MQAARRVVTTRSTCRTSSSTCRDREAVWGTNYHKFTFSSPLDLLCSTSFGLLGGGYQEALADESFSKLGAPRLTER